MGMRIDLRHSTEEITSSTFADKFGLPQTTFYHKNMKKKTTFRKKKNTLSNKFKQLCTNNNL